ncbi:MAG: glycerol acyltransferase [Elainellaceae cyanobacterium]
MPPVTQAQPPLEFIPPNFNPLVYFTSQSLLPLWMRWQVQITEVQVKNPEILVNLFQQFQTGKTRFMLAFRHASVDDPYCLYALLSQHIPKVAKQQGVYLQPPVHAHFMYDRGIPLWAGSSIGWLFSRLGGTPIRRGKLDLPGLRSARQLFANGRFPIAAAPEGATNGHNEIVSPIEPGVPQLGFWCVEDLQKANRAETVVIVPIGIQYRYTLMPWSALDALLSQLEGNAGLSAPTLSEAEVAAIRDRLPLEEPQQIQLYQRLIRVGEALLSEMETFYSKFYHQQLVTAIDESSAEEGTRLETADRPLVNQVNQRIAQRLQTLVDTALRVAEEYFGVPSKGDLNERCRRLEQAGWDRIYREDLKQLENLAPIQRGLADRVAEEADLRLWHMRLVESFVSVTGHYILEKPTVERFAETLLLLWDVVARMKGENPFPRPRLGPQSVQITIGEPISVSDRWQAYKTNRRQALGQLTQDLQTALEQMII